MDQSANHIRPGGQPGAAVDNKLGALDAKLTGTDGKVGALANRIDRLDDRIGDTDDRIGLINERIASIDDRMHSVDAHVALVEEHTAPLDSRLGAMEAQMARTGAKVEALTGRIERLDGRIDGQVTALRGTLHERLSGALTPLADELRMRPGHAEVEEVVAKVVSAAHAEMTARLDSLEETVLTLAEALLRPARRIPDQRHEGERS
jgi:archaellum component FlaC